MAEQEVMLCLSAVQHSTHFSVNADMQWVAAIMGC